jgi:hypothetical protein
MKKLMIALLSFSASINTYANSGGLSIEIVAGMDKASSSVKASGIIKTPVTDSDLYGFGVSKIGHCLGVWSGHNPGDNVYTTYANDTKHNLFKKYNWTPLSRILKAKSAKILEITAKPTIIASIIVRGIPSRHEGRQNRFIVERTSGMSSRNPVNIRRLPNNFLALSILVSTELA